MGRLAEQAAARKFHIRLERDSWHDARFKTNGSPLDVKAAKYRKGDRYGRFMLWRGQHEELRKRQGGYILAIVGENNGSLRVLKLVKIGCRELERQTQLNWYSMSNKKDSHGTKIPWPQLLDYR